MSRLRIAVVALVVAVCVTIPAAAQATVSTTNISTWTSSDSGTPSKSSYLVSYDNAPTTLAVTGSATGVTKVDIVCYFGSQGSSEYKVLASNLSVSNGAFNTGGSPPQLRQIAGHACRLRAVPTGQEASDDFSSLFTGPQVAIGETALLPTVAGGPNTGATYNFYVNPVTFTGFAAWKAAGTGGCGPYAAPIDSGFDIGSFPIDCAGSLLGDDLSVWGGRSEVEVDGRSAYDATSAQGLFARTNGLYNGSEDLSGFPSLKVNVTWDPTTGLMASQSQEEWVRCDGSDSFPASVGNCPKFDDTGVRLERDVTASDGGRVITLTDTWSSSDGQSHSLDLLYDDYAGVFGNATGERGWNFPGQSGFTQYGTDDSVPAPSSGPGSIFVRTNVGAVDGDPSAGAGAITFSRPPSGLRFASNNELEEHQLLTVPAGGSTSLSYIYSVGYSVADASGLAMLAQDRLQPPAVAITSPGGGSTVSTPSVTLAGTAGAGSGIKSLVVAGQAVPVDSAGAWSAQVPLNPGSNTITAVASDGAGASVQAQVTVVYQPPATTTIESVPSATCRVPRLKGMKLAKAEKALRRAGCRVGKIKRVKSRKVGSGRVISTSPPAGRRVRAGNKVELFVSKGR